MIRILNEESADFIGYDAKYLYGNADQKNTPDVQGVSKIFIV